MDVLPIVAPRHGAVECPWRLIGLGEKVLYITVFTRGAGWQPTSAWTEDTLTQLTLHVMATKSPTTGTNSWAVTVCKVHLPTPLGDRLLCNAGTHVTVPPSATSES